MIRLICTDISDAGSDVYARLYRLASPERRARADRYRSQADSLRCVTAEALLRFALGTDTFQTEKTAHGKPFLPERPDFHYNLSHSGRWVVIAFGSSEVGVDVEQLRESTDIHAIASRFFSPSEQRYVLEDPAESRSRFFEIWTGKESYIKYLGTGLKQELSSFSVLQPEPGVRYFQRQLPGDYYLSLCAGEPGYSFELLDIRRLI